MSDDDTPKKTDPLGPVVSAVKKCWDIIEELPFPDRARVIRWIADTHDAALPEHMRQPQQQQTRATGPAGVGG